MVFECHRKGMAACAVSHKEYEVRRCGFQRRLQAGQAWVGNGRWRQTAVYIGVPRSIFAQFTFAQTPPNGPLPPVTP